MNSKKNREKVEDPLLDFGPLFETDPITGKMKVLPLTLKSDSVTTKLSSSKRKRQIPAMFKDLKPLSEMDFDFGEIDGPGKRARPSNSVRKGLFSNPSRLLPRASYLGKRKPSISKIPPATPLMNLDKAEKVLCQKASIKELNFQSPTIIVSQALAGMEITRHMVPPMCPKSTSTTQNKNASITKQKQDNCSPNKDPNLTCLEQTEIIQDILTKHQLAFEEFEREHQSSMLQISEILETQNSAFERYKKIHRHTVQRLSSMVDANGNTPTRRNSLRLQKNSVPKCVVSPRIEKGSNMLKSLLKKNFSEKQDQDSPRTKKATELYNKIRSVNSKILETPNANRNLDMGTPKTQGMKDLSKKIQKQCLLLQDTPLAKCRL